MRVDEYAFGIRHDLSGLKRVLKTFSINISSLPNQRQMRVDEYAFGIRHDLSGLKKVQRKRNTVKTTCLCETVFDNELFSTTR